ncbi:hypothetical protein AB4Y87_19955 [Paenarthrobacter sp. RAF54_2]|uniref:hypothetical protein n=1 Tax=Paenarthrobacter sp. RAF54_2 TaxID=3233061 RepID=UPI003F99EA91
MAANAGAELLSDLYLDDSYVLDIQASRGRLAITMEFALAPERPPYSPALPGEQYCYRKGVLVFEGVTELNWTGQLTSRPSRDPDGSIDYGNIDALVIDGNHYTVEGGMGRINLQAAAIRVALVSDGTTRTPPQ